MKTRILALLLFFNVLGLQNTFGQIIWTQKANKPTKTICRGVHYKGKIYISYINSAGNISIEEYNPANDTWIAKKGISNNKNGGEYCLVASTSGIYIIGGYLVDKPSNKVEQYDPDLDKFINKKDMPFGIDCSTASSVNDKIYLIGGVLPNTSTGNNKTYEYDPATETWTAKKNAPRSRSEHYSISIDNKIYTWGGFSGNSKANYVDVYDPVSDTWTAGTQNIESGKWGYGMGYAKGALYFMLGTTVQVGGSPSLLKEEIYRYDLQTKTSAKVEDKTNAIWFNATVSVNDSIYLIGGEKGAFLAGPLQNVTEVFTPSTTTGIGLLPKGASKLPATIRYNPGTGKIELSCDKQLPKETLVKVVGLDGRTIYSNKHLNIYPKAEIPAVNFPSRIYIVSIRSDQDFISEKIMLN